MEHLNLQKAYDSLKATYEIALKKLEKVIDDKQQMRQEIFRLKKKAGEKIV